MSDEERFGGRAWRVLIPKKPEKPPGVSVYSGGSSHLTALGWEGLGAPDAVVILWSEDGQVFALRPPGKGDVGRAFKLSRVSRRKRPTETRTFSGVQLKTAGVPVGFYPGKFIDGALVCPVAGRVPLARGKQS
jgi:hypothetical protein